MKIKGYRWFDGKRFKKGGRYVEKRTALNLAKHFRNRNKGNKARVVPEYMFGKKHWRVWVRSG